MRCSDRCRCREVKIRVTVRTVRRDKKAASVCREVAVVEKFRELKKTTTATATATSRNKSFNEQNNSCARTL